MYLVAVSILREQYAIREQIYIIISVDSLYFYGSLMFYELCLLKSIWNVSFVTAVAPCFTFLHFSPAFFMSCFTLGFHTTEGSFKHSQS